MTVCGWGVWGVKEEGTENGEQQNAPMDLYFRKKRYHTVCFCFDRGEDSPTINIYPYLTEL
jgi:hypothetical protein